MKISQLLGTTLRQTSRDTELVSHDLLLRAGFIRQLSAGIFSVLHLGQRSMNKIERVLREEMDRIGGVEISMPVVHPAELWQKTGRYDAIDDSLVRFKDRTDRGLVLAMTHEEVVADLVSTEISSYKQLPKLVYQIQTKFRDELRSRGGLIRVKEFRMKDSYSLDSSWEGLERQYIAHYNAYFRMMARVGLPVVAVQSDVGMMGGKIAHEFMYLTPVGEDSIFLDTGSDYKANKEVARVKKIYPEPVEALPLAKIFTPGTKTIQDLADFLNIEAAQTAKVVFYTGSAYAWEQDKLIIAVIRGDMDVNEISIKNLSKAEQMRVATEEEITAVGCVAGFASPIDIKRDHTLVIVDDLVANSANLVTGANENDYHLLNSNYGRDYGADLVADIALAYDGAPSLSGGTLEVVRGVEVGNIFQLGTKYAEALDATFMNEQGRPEPVIMGSYGIGVGRLLACLAEEYHDEDGLRFPVAVAPYEVMLVSLADSEATVSAADTLYEELVAAGFELLYDDRPKKMAGPGVKFKDADLLGIPVRITVSRKTLAEESVEVKLRTEKEKILVPIAQIGDHLDKAIAALWVPIRKMLDEAEGWPE